MTEGEGRRRVILTFDDGPNPGCTDALLDLLGELGIRATFCVVGQNILAPGGAELVRRTVEEGHAICNHSIDYEDLGSLPAAEVRSRLGETTRIIRDALGDPDFPVRWFRAPNGSWGPNDEVADLARSLGMAPLRLGNVIHDWTDEWQVADVLEVNLRTAIRPAPWCWPMTAAAVAPLPSRLSAGCCPSWWGSGASTSRHSRGRKTNAAKTGVECG